MLENELKNKNFKFNENEKKLYIENYKKLEKLFKDLKINIKNEKNYINDYNLYNYKNDNIKYMLDILYYYYRNDYINLSLNNKSLLIIKRNDLKKYKLLFNEKNKYNNEYYYNMYLFLNKDYVILFNVYENNYLNNEYNLNKEIIRIENKNYIETFLNEIKINFI